jgi:chemotaxis protein MotB
MKPKTLAPIYIIRKKRSVHAAHHGGAWKVAYADFVTAMMAFFMVMWLVNQDPSVKKAIAGYFKDPGVFAQQRSISVNMGGRPGVEAGQSVQRAPQRASSDDSVRSEQRTLAKTVEGIRTAMESMRDVAELKDQIEFTMSSEGLRVELVDKPGSSFFGSGSASLRGESVKLLTVIAAELAKLDNQMVVEGHTDSQQYSAAAHYNNWKLSTDRANAALEVMEAAGLKAEMIQAVKGFADRELHVPGDPLDPSNRRVSILVRNRDVASIADKARLTVK